MRDLRIISVSAQGPFGERGGPNMFLPVEGESNTNKDKTIRLHEMLSKRHDDNFFKATGIRMIPLKRDEIAKIACAYEWQTTPESEKESGGAFYPDTQQSIELEAEARGVDLKRFETVAAQRGLRIPQLRKTELVSDSRAAFSPAGNPDAMAINYLHQFQYLQSISGKLQGIIPEENQIDIPNGYQTYTVPKLGFAQYLKQGATTTESYATNTAVTPGTTSTTYAPSKFQTVIFMAGEFVEDSVAPILPALEQSARVGHSIMFDHLMFSGDDHNDNTNINANGITPLGALDPRLAWRGFRALNYWGTIGGKASGTFTGGVNLGGAPFNLNAVAELLKSLGIYGDNPNDVYTIIPVALRHQLMQDAKARPDTYRLLLEMRNGLLYSVAGSRIISLGNSLITNAHSGGVPTYAGWVSEGAPINLAANGTYTGAGNLTSAVAVNTRNWVIARKRSWMWRVVDLPLADQVAVTSSSRLDAKPIFDNVSESVAYNIGGI